MIWCKAWVSAGFIDAKLVSICWIFGIREIFWTFDFFEIFTISRLIKQSLLFSITLSPIICFLVCLLICLLVVRILFSSHFCVFFPDLLAQRWFFSENSYFTSSLLYFGCSETLKNSFNPHYLQPRIFS